MSFPGLPGSATANEGDLDLRSSELSLQGLNWDFDPYDPLLFDWDVQASPAPPVNAAHSTLPSATQSTPACEASSIPAIRKTAKRKTPQNSKVTLEIRWLLLESSLQAACIPSVLFLSPGKNLRACPEGGTPPA